MIDGPSMMRWVVGYEGLYLVHRDGYVVNRRALTMTTKIDRYGYANVRLNRGGEQKWKKVHRLVCEAWNGQAPTPAHHAAHLDGDKQNNRPENLAWATAAENSAHKKQQGRPNGGGAVAGERHPMARLNDKLVAEIRRVEGASVRELARQYGVSFSQISRIRSGKAWPTAQRPKGVSHDR